MKTKIFEQHREHNKWENELKFYRDELKIMENRLAEVSGKYTAAEVQKQVEHFQNQFLIQNDNLGRLMHLIGRNEKVLQDAINRNPVSSDHRSAEDHATERAMVENFEHNLTELRKEFNVFVAKYL
jgi:hypothetical protein